MQRRNTMVAAVAVVSAMSLTLAGCGNKEATGENGKPLVTIMSQINADTKVKPEETEWFKKLEAACDCEIQWDTVSVDAWSNQKNAVATSGEVADISIALFSATDLSGYPYFEDLSDDLDAMPNVQAMFKEWPSVERAATTLDGKIYQVPNFVNPKAGENFKDAGTGQTVLINKTWLDKLGLEVPQTWDELVEVLTAFKTQDPNGNGEADEIPWNVRAMETGGFGWYSPFQLINSTGLSTQLASSAGMTGIYVKDGKVGNFLQTDNFRETVEFLAKLTNEDLIPKAGWTKDDSKWNSELKSDGKTAISGMAVTWDRNSFGELADQYVSMAIPSSTSDPTDAVAEQYQAGTYDGIAVKADAENKEAILKIVNAMVDPDLSMAQYYGDLDTYVTKDGENEYTVKPEALEGTSVVHGIANRGFAYIPPTTVLHGQSDLEIYNEDSQVYADQMPGADSKDYMPFYVTPSDEDLTTISNNNAAIMNYVVTQTSQWILNGGLNDGTWSEFQGKIKDLGIEQNVELWQKWYDKYEA